MQRPLLIQMQRRSVNVFAVFADSVRRQVKEHKDLTKNIELLGESSTKLKESETVLKASAAISQTSKATSQMLNAVGSAVNKTLEHPVMKSTGAAISHTVSTVSHVSQQIAEPILDTQAARTVGKGISQIKKDVIGSASNAFYQEYKPREERMRERQEMIQDRKIVRGANGLPVKRGPVAANDEAMGIELHQGSRIASAWSKFKSESELGQRLFGFTQKIDETDSPFMNRVRGIRGSFNMNENETATVVRALRQVDPEFSEHAFLKEVTQFTAPDLIEAYLGGDLATLRIWCGERAYARLSSDIEAQQKQGLVSDSKLLDIRSVQIQKMELLDDSIPIILVSCQTHEILLFRNKKGEIVVGQEDHIVTGQYMLAFAQQMQVDSDAEYNEETNGWIVLDWARGQH